jgi:hypothetical protein
VLDLVLNNEGQESAMLLGDVAAAGKHAAVTVQGVGVGSRVRVLGADGKPVQTRTVSGGEGRGGQSAPVARFALPPGSYVVELRDSAGRDRTKSITVANAPMKVALQ